MVSIAIIPLPTERPGNPEMLVDDHGQARLVDFEIHDLLGIEQAERVQIHLPDARQRCVLGQADQAADRLVAARSIIPGRDYRIGGVGQEIGG